MYTISLKPYTTFAVDVYAKQMIEINQNEDIYRLLSETSLVDHEYIILWTWANILFTKDYPGIVIKNNIKGIDIIDETSTQVFVKVASWEIRHDTIMWMLDHGYVGAENMVYIPSSVGAAVFGNIWAYGKEAKDIIYQVETIDLATGEKKLRDCASCKFWYRDSIFKHLDHIYITSATFVLEKNRPTYHPMVEYQDIQMFFEQHWQDIHTVSARQLADAIIEIRKHKLPDWQHIGTAGSFFKNPIVSSQQFTDLQKFYPQLKWHFVPNGVKLSAGQLIELAWYKGKRIGNVWTYEKHALVIVQYGNATGEEVWHFAQMIKKKVQELFGVSLEPEVIIK